MLKMNKALFLEENLSYESSLPLYYQLNLIIRRMLENGDLSPGDMLPTEEDFCNTYQLSRSTVRQALSALVDDGLLVRVRGKGTFVSKQKLRRRVESVYSFTHEIEAAGMKASSRIVTFRKIKPHGDIANILSMRHDEEEVFYIIRIRMADDVPMLMETVFIPVHFIPNLTEERLQGRSLYNILRDEEGVFPAYAEESYESIIIEKGICALLECPSNTPGFYIERRTTGKEGGVYELTQSIMRGDRSKIVITLKQGSYSFKKQYENNGSEINCLEK